MSLDSPLEKVIFCASEVVNAPPHSWLVIFELPHAPNHPLPPLGPEALGVVIAGLARVVIDKFTNHEWGDAFTTSLATK